MDNSEKLATFGTQDTRRRHRKQKQNIICYGHHYTQANTNNVNTTCALLQTTGGKDEPNIVCMRKSSQRCSPVRVCIYSNVETLS